MIEGKKGKKVNFTMSPHAMQDLKSVPTGTNNWWKEATVYQVSHASKLKDQ
jgi:hypothetical protein